MHSVAIIDTSSLIFFEKLERFDILNKTYNQLITTPEIRQEFGNPLPEGFIIKTGTIPSNKRFLETQLDLGEASAIALAMEIKNTVLILDDLKARKIAKQLGLRLTGSLGVLMKAQQMGIIQDIRPLIGRLRKTNFRISDNIIEALLKKK